ncbi:MAG: curli assembly protein CsgF [Mariprofundaceae bacterium]|nr:curli assembly protein CsgF [Mariprofundaceae bacterium]
MKRMLFSMMLALVFSAGTAFAEQIVYRPINPSFGGSPSNAPGLLANANAQNNFKDPAAVNALKKLSPLQQFQQNLQQFVLNRIAASVTGSIIGANGTLIPGTINTTDFTIQVVSLGGTALRIITTDKNTGQTTFFQVN